MIIPTNIMAARQNRAILVNLALLGLLFYVASANLMPVSEPLPSNSAQPAASERGKRPQEGTTALRDALATRVSVAGELAAADDTVRRPLFDAERRPRRRELGSTSPEASSPASGQVPGSSLDFKFVGVVTTGGGGAWAVVTDEAFSGGRLVKVGEHLGVWRLREIGTDSIVIELRGERRTVALFQSKAASAPR